ncbi:TPA: hypothetical protein ACK0KF_000741 [Staphylococcus aureus]|uniref:hypothetical protein n=1 Tax=Staphylococcus aureus TaxID=1280 RepID=UPI001303194C|nr:hypothetical protein [Staphylococcus aureus]QGY86989.1 hypothetical protein F1612_00915 [Staphylococcus aureus]
MAYSILNLYSILIQCKCKINHKKEIQYLHPRKTSQLPLILKIILNLSLIGIVIIVFTHAGFKFNAGDSNVFLLNWDIRGLTSYIFSFLILVALVSKLILLFITRRQRTS